MTATSKKPLGRKENKVEVRPFGSVSSPALGHGEGLSLTILGFMNSAQ